MTAFLQLGQGLLCVKINWVLNEVRLPETRQLSWNELDVKQQLRAKGG